MLSRACLALAALGLLAGGARVEGAQMTYPCYRPSVAPVPDGDIAGDPGWRDIPAATGFSVLGGTYAALKQTDARACWVDEALYVAMSCEEPDAPLIKPTVPDGGPAWLDDGVEIFVQPAGSGHVYQFVITAGGARGSGEVFPDIAQVQVGAKIGHDAYSVEARIPYSILGARPAVGGRWRGNFCRNIFTKESGGDQFTSWAPLRSRFMEPENFAVLAFLGPAPDAEEAQRIAESINRPYRVRLVAELRAAAAEEPEYAPALREASRDAEFGQRASDLQGRWREAEAAVRSAGQVPLPELRRIVRGADALLKDSYNLKYAYLIARLLREN
jgi:hypothetical protein